MRWWVIWTLVLILAAWWDHRSKACRWRVHRPVKKIERTVEIKPIRFRNASILWMNTLSDEVDLTLVDVSDPDMGDVDVQRLETRVYGDVDRTDLLEIYETAFDVSGDDMWNYTFLENDAHLSPFRRLVVYPKVTWTLGQGSCQWCFPRWGYFNRGWWVEPKPLRLSIWFTAWAAGIVAAWARATRSKGRQLRFR